MSIQTMELGAAASRPAAARMAGIGAIDPAHATIALIALGIVLRIAVAYSVGFGSDESYTVANARYLALSYVDYPPLHLWLTHAWVWLFHCEDPGSLRIPFIVLFAGSTWLMFRLTGALFNARAGFWSALALNLAPVFALPHASWVLPDGPLIFFMLAAALVFARQTILGGANLPSLGGWLAVGLLTGLAALSKYHGAFLALAFFLFLLSERHFRGLLRTPGPWLGVGVAALIFLPVIVWNSEHSWIGFFFQSGRLDGHGLDPMRSASGIAGQAAYLSPWLFILLAIVLIEALRRGPRSPRTWFLALLAIGPIVVFTASDLLSPGLPHWTMPGWLFAFPLLGAGLARQQTKRPAILIAGSAMASGALLLLVALFTAQATSGTLTRDLPARFSGADPTLDMLSWQQAGKEIGLRGLLGGEVRAIAATKWFEAGKLNYALGEAVPVLCLCKDRQEFQFLHDERRFAGDDIIIVGRDTSFERQPLAFAEWFDRVEMLSPIILRRGGEPAMTLNIFRGVGFHPERISR